MSFLSRDVFEHRFTMMKNLMASRLLLDGLLFTSEDFISFATNFTVDVRVFERPIACFVKKNSDVFAFFNQLSFNHFKMAQDRKQPWIDRVVFYDEHPDGPNQARLLTNWIETFSEMLRTEGLQDSRIGVESIGAIHREINKLLPNIQFISLGEEIKMLRAVKHEEEVVLMSKACEMTDWMQEKYIDNIRPGRFTQELDAAIFLMAYEEAQKRFCGDNIIFSGYTLTGPASASPHGNGARTGSIIQKGDVLVNMIIPVINGLTVENERTYFCGEPSDEQKKAYAAALLANKAAIRKIKIGNRVSDIENAARTEIVDAGFSENLCHRTGHGLGLIGHEWPVNMAFEDRLLLKNEVYSAEPGIYIYGLGGFRIDDTVVVGETPTVLTNSPKEIVDITIKT